jgi:hypothetical protein
MSVMNNAVFWKALRLLSHPASLTALGVLLLNDHLLRRIWPSWVTGKIGDFAWLFFAPFIVAAVLAWLVPLRGARREKAIRLLAFTLTGSVFALAKTVPGVHTWLLHVAERLLGLPISLRRDPTDLIALVVLAFSWRLWAHQRASTPSLRAPGWAALSFAVLLTVANSMAPDIGVERLSAGDGRVYACSTYEAFVSEDGGLSWSGTLIALREICPYDAESTEFDQLVAEMGDWQLDSGYVPATEAERAYYEKTHSGDAEFEPGPLDAITDPLTRNVILAMGHEGVAVHTPDDEWHWVSVGEYRRVRLGTPSTILSLLSGEAVLSFYFGLLCFCTLALRVNWSWFRIGFLAVAWAMWGLLGILFPPSLTTGYGSVFLSVGLMASAVLIVGLALFSAFRAFQRGPDVSIRLAIVAVVGMLLVFAPFVMWAKGSIPSHTAAVLFATFLGAIVLLAGDRWMKRSLSGRRSAVISSR